MLSPAHLTLLLRLPISPNDNILRRILQPIEEGNNILVTIPHTEMRQNERCLGPLAHHLFEILPLGMLRLLRLRIMLIIQETALGNHHRDPLHQPLRLSSQRRCRRITEKRKHGRRHGCRQLHARLPQTLELRAGERGILGLELMRRGPEDVTHGGDVVVALKDEGVHAFEPPQRHHVAVSDGRRDVRAEKGPLPFRPALLVGALAVDLETHSLGVAAGCETAAVEEGLCEAKVVKGLLHLDGAEDVWRVFALGEGWGEEAVV